MTSMQATRTGALLVTLSLPFTVLTVCTDNPMWSLVAIPLGLAAVMLASLGVRWSR